MELSGGDQQYHYYDYRDDDDDDDECKEDVDIKSPKTRWEVRTKELILIIVNVILYTGCFFHWPSPKKLWKKYGKPR